MADNTTKVPLSTKQKVIAVLFVVITCFVIYEVMGLFSSEKPSAPAIKPTAQTTIQPKSIAGRTEGSVGGPASLAMQPSASDTLTPVNAITFPKENADVQKQQQQQQQQQQSYLDSVNQLQLLKVKREIAETNQAIASARLATETANKSMSDLLTQPAVLPMVPGGSDMGKMSTTQSGDQLSDKMPPPIVKSQVLDIPFTVVSVSMQFNRWNAVLGYENKLYSVLIGDSLFDGSKVVTITKNGVTLLKDGLRRKISIQTTI